MKLIQQLCVCACVRSMKLILSLVISSWAAAISGGCVYRDSNCLCDNTEQEEVNEKCTHLYEHTHDDNDNNNNNTENASKHWWLIIRTRKKQQQAK